ncbi:hypothetical protein EDD85DRAFT_962540 [Armillaria nabsnona]|nr:hypothetical protein EDD85DRAFT_962540 [Armillaria nabsnona]
MVAAMATFSFKTAISSSKNILRLALSQRHHRGPWTGLLFLNVSLPELAATRFLQHREHQLLRGGSHGMLLSFTATFPLRFYLPLRVSASRRALSIIAVTVSLAFRSLGRVGSTVEHQQVSEMVYTPVHGSDEKQP